MGNSAQAFDRIRSDLKRLAESRLTPETRYARIREDLLRVQTRAGLRAAFRDNADVFFERAFAAPDYAVLADRVDRSKDPALLATSLLGSLNRSRRETLHTQALGAMLDPQRCAHGELLLCALLEQVRPGLSMGVDLKSTSIRVEHALDLPRKGRTTRPRPDIIIELRAAEKAAPSRVVVIENKIDALDRDGQLDDYSEAASLRYPQTDLCLVYLTLRGSNPTQKIESSWQNLSYETVALVLRRQLAILDADERASHAWRELIRLYLATLVQDLLRWVIFDQESRAARWRARRYLHAAAPENNNA